MDAIFTRIESPIGRLTLTGDGDALTGLYMEIHRGGPGPVPRARRDDSAFAAAREQLAAYFAGDLREFDLQLAPSGSAWQMRVWDALREIPYGETVSYGEIARRVGAPDASRAVGTANGSNPIAIIVPCHRVIGANGKLTGYGGGLDRKRFLLGLERGELSFSHAA